MVTNEPGILWPYEVAGENGHRVRLLAEDELDAFEGALMADPDIEEASVVLAEGPVGGDGGDPHDAEPS